MKISKDSLAARAKNISHQRKISAQVVYSRFFFDSFLLRLSHSQYKDLFVLKGGLLLSSLYGVEERTTLDMDFLLRQHPMDPLRLKKMFEEIAADSSSEDGIEFSLLGYDRIQTDDPRGGYSFHWIGRLENVRVPFSVDVAVGDPVTPEVRDYAYPCLVSQEILHLWSYPIETIVAEKFETVISKGEGNSRMKDYYDLVLIQKTGSSSSDSSVLADAFEATCLHRGFSVSPTEIFSVIDLLKNSDLLQIRWHAYQRKFPYAQDIVWNDVIQVLRKWGFLLCRTEDKA